MPDPIEGFEKVERGNSTVLVNPTYRDKLSAALFDGEALTAGPDAGRGTVQLCDLGDTQAVIREYRRGGFVRHFLNRHYLLDNRAYRELNVWNAASEAGLRVPRALGALWRKTGPFYSGAFVSEYVESMHLEDWLNKHTVTDERESMMLNVGDSIRQLHEAKIAHADLQVRNILVTASQVVLLIDFDNAKLLSHPDADLNRRSLHRFGRSLVKRGFDQSLLATAIRGYSPDGGFTL